MTKFRVGNETMRVRYDWSEIFLVIAVFSKMMGTRDLFGFDFDFISYPFYIIYFLCFTRRLIQANTGFIWFYVFIIATSLFSIFFLNLGYAGFFKQIFAVIVIYSVAYTIMSGVDVVYLYRLYVKVAYWSAIFGIIQVILSLGGIMIMTITVGRMNSVAYEPSHYAAILLPALLFSFFHIKEYKREFLIMLIALVLTFNLTGYMVFLFIITFAYLNPVYVIFSAPIFYFIVFYGLANFNDNFSTRINETLSVFKGQNSEILGRSVSVNGTTTSFYSNLTVAINNVKKNFLFGAGMGGHYESYHRFYLGSFFKMNYFYGLNAQSGHSLTIRIFSEFGVVGFVLYVYTIIKNLIFKDAGYYKSISLGCLSHFLCKSLKLGGYIDYGTPFFFVMLLINHIQYKISKQQ